MSDVADPSVGVPPVDAVPMELPGQPGRTSWAYIMPEPSGRAHLIDCGADSPRNRTALANALARRGRLIEDISSVTGTHAHVDHIGMAAHLQRVAGAEIRLHAHEADVVREGRSHGGPHPEVILRRWGVPGDRWPALLTAAGMRVASGERPEEITSLHDGDALELPGWSLRVLSTPGHTGGHICLVDRRHSVAFVGDHVLPRQFPAPGLGGPTRENPVQEYLTSLTRLRDLGVRRLYPGHDEEITDVPGRIDAVRAHHEGRRRAVAAAALRADTVWECAAAIRWSGGWESLTGIRLFSALGQVDHHLQALSPAQCSMEGLL